MKNQNLQLNIGDEIGFVTLGQSADDADKVIFFPVAEITKRDGETAYRYMYPDGEISASAIRQSQLSNHVVKVRRTTIETIEPQVSDKMICISERRTEFVEALNRGKNSDLEVYADWDKDAFVVVNNDKAAEYRVKLETRNNKIFGECECKDFEFRKRTCKHISAVLVDAFFTVKI